MSALFENYGLTSIDHITHVDNLPSILKNGLYSHNNSFVKKDISNNDVNSRRHYKEPIYNHNVHDYVPFYFNPRNAMMYNVRHENVVVLQFSTKLMYQENVIFTNQNAATNNVTFINDINDLKHLNWKSIRAKSWNDQPSYVKQQMMAEVLIYNYVPITYLRRIYCKDISTRHHIAKLLDTLYTTIPVKVKRDEFFF